MLAVNKLIDGLLVVSLQALRKQISEVQRTTGTTLWQQQSSNVQPGGYELSNVFPFERDLQEDIIAEVGIQFLGFDPL